jgi:hypothetical protein
VIQRATLLSSPVHCAAYKQAEADTGVDAARRVTRQLLSQQAIASSLIEQQPCSTAAAK